MTDEVEDGGGGELPEWAQRIQALTARAGIPQAELARRAGMSRDAYNRYYRGATRPPYKQAVALARLFGVEVRDIDPDRDGIAALHRAGEASREAWEEETEYMEARSRPAYSLHPPSSGDPGMVRLRVDADIPLESATTIISLLQRDPKP